MNKIFPILVILQLIIICVLGYFIYQKKESVLGEQIINSINNENIQYTKSNYKYFYELKPNSVVLEGQWIDFYKGEYRSNADTFREDKDYVVDKLSKPLELLHWVIHLHMDCTSM